MCENGSILKSWLCISQVRFECDPTATMDVIMRIDEPQSCEYIIVVATKKICSIPQFRPHELQKPKEIKCSPGKRLFLK